MTGPTTGDRIDEINTWWDGRIIIMLVCTIRVREQSSYSSKLCVDNKCGQAKPAVRILVTLCQTPQTVTARLTSIFDEAQGWLCAERSTE